jgi:alpha-glucosidase (family GH31 glycosyl hydrolase)
MSILKPTMQISRRTALIGLGAGASQLLFTKRLIAAGTGSTAAPGSLNLALAALTPGLLRISISPANDEPRTEELGVVDGTWRELGKAGLEKSDNVSWGKYTLKVSAGEVLSIAALEGTTIRQEVRFDLDSTNVRFNLDGPAFGLGEGPHPFDRRETHDAMLNGQNGQDLRTYGARLPIPWIVSPAGWGVFIGQPSGSMMFSQTEATFRGSEATATRNVYLVLGDSPGDLLKEYANLTGHPHLPPLWALGYQQSHRTLADRAEILDVVKTFREKRLPCDAVIYLGTGFCPSGWNTGHGSFTFNDKVFPDPEVMLKQIHDDHMRVIVHVVPPGDLHGKIGDKDPTGGGPGYADKYWAKHAEVAKAGVDAWWPDEGDRLSVYARLDRNQLYWDGSLKINPAQRPFALHRNGYAGLQRFGWLWSGDTWSTWEALHSQILAGINVGLSGIPYWGSDTGGFVPTIEYTPELFVRWFQFSAFCPSFRSHGRAWKLHLPWGWNLGTSGPKEVEGDWVASWPPEADMHRADVEGICRKYLNLRYQLLPYLYSAAAQTHTSGMPIIRALWLMYPQDKNALLVDNQYLWGDNILVAPVYEKGATQRNAYLPAGRWWNYWTNEPVEGGKEITVSAPLDTLPLFVKAGAVIAIGPTKQHTGEAVSESVTLQVYPGADGSFTWFDDDGSSFEYERGNYMRVICEWNDRRRLLTLTRDPQGKLGIGRQVRVKIAGTSRTRDAVIKDGALEIQL